MYIRVRLGDEAAPDADAAFRAGCEDRQRVLDPFAHVRPFAATTSTSTLNSSRANPETTISVEAGGGSAVNSSRAAM